MVRLPEITNHDMSKSKTPHPPPLPGRDSATGAKPGDAPAQDQGMAK